MAYIETKTGSWAWELEKEHESDLLMAATPFAEEDWLSEEEIQPYAINPQAWVQVEAQLSQGSCRGHSGSSALETCRVIAGNTYLQLSRANFYYETQRIDGIRTDSGSTMGGGVKLLQRGGIVSEADWPYPSRYNPTRPSGFESMTKYTTEGHRMIRSAGGRDATDIAIQHLCHRKQRGPIDIGIRWSAMIDQQAQSGVIRNYSFGRRDGGHAIYIGGPVDRLWDGTSIGDWAVLLANSWSLRWGFKGWVIVLRQAFNEMMSGGGNEGIGHFGYKGPKSSFDDLMS